MTRTHGGPRPAAAPPAPETAPDTARATAPLDTVRVVGTVLAPIVARGVLIRRRRLLAALERVDADRRAVRLLQRLRRRYGPGPLRVALPGRSVAIVLTAADARRVLDESDGAFAVASREKRAALAHFQPRGVLASTGAVRRKRRAFNEAVLDTGAPMHRLGQRIAAVVDDELGRMLADRGGPITWDEFTVTWWQLVRRIVLGEQARDDHEVTDLLGQLRGHANWAFARPRAGHTRRRFERRLREHLDRAEPGSLAALVADTPAGPDVDAAQQLPQWLFAFDAVGIAVFQALGLLATHRPEHELAAPEWANLDSGTPHERPYLRACLLEAVRLWPTTPAILRDSTVETHWAGGPIPAGTAFVVLAPFLHRDDATVPFADRFSPEVWLDDPESGRDDVALVPFSAGPGRCPGRELVLLVGSTALAAVMSRVELRVRTPVQLDPARPLPGTLNPFTMRFDVQH